MLCKSPRFRIVNAPPAEYSKVDSHGLRRVPPIFPPSATIKTDRGTEKERRRPPHRQLTGLFAGGRGDGGINFRATEHYHWPSTLQRSYMLSDLRPASLRRRCCTHRYCRCTDTDVPALLRHATATLLRRRRRAPVAAVGVEGSGAGWSRRLRFGQGRSEGARTRAS